MKSFWLPTRTALCLVTQKSLKNPERLKEIDVNTVGGSWLVSKGKFIDSRALKFKPKNINVRVINRAHGNLIHRGHSNHRRLSLGARRGNRPSFPSCRNHSDWQRHFGESSNRGRKWWRKPNNNRCSWACQ